MTLEYLMILTLVATLVPKCTYQVNLEIKGHTLVR